MKRLIIVTGISGSGKSTISNYIYKHYKNSTLISIDALKEKLCELIGFYNYEQKQNLKQISYNIFMELLNECMRRYDENIIIEYPFSRKWENKFKELVNKYNYVVVTIRLKGTDYDTIYKRLKERDNSCNRHPSHSLNNYNPKEKKDYKSTCTLNYEKLRQDYESNKYSSINLGKTIDIVNNNIDYDKLIKQIDDLE